MIQDPTTIRLLATVEHYFDQGWEAVERCDFLWAKAHDPEIDADFRRTWRSRYERAAAYARTRTRFHRHDVALDALQQRIGAAALADHFQGEPHAHS